MATKRIEYIDAMRGFAMLLVVYSHIIFFGYSDMLNPDGGKLLTFNTLFLMFRMPLFFFISGFILYKKDYEWNLNNCFSFLIKKAKIQLIPTIFFLSLYTILMDISLGKSLISAPKAGYWFTISLFEFFVIYVIYRFICRLIKKREGFDLILLVIGIMIDFAVTIIPNQLHIYDSNISLILGLPYIRYFIFFAIGTLVKKHFITVQKALDNGYITGLGILIFITLSIYEITGEISFTSGLVTGVVSRIIYLIIGFLGLMIVFSFFRKYQSAFSSETRLGKTLQYIGRRTLDIYLLHYFFLPRHLDSIGKFFTDNPNPTLELFSSLILAALVIALCLILSNIIRISPILGHWLFGVKLPDNKNENNTLKPA